MLNGREAAERTASSRIARPEIKKDPRIFLGAFFIKGVAPFSILIGLDMRP